MNTEYFVKLFNQSIFSDISIILKDTNEQIHLNAHRNILASNDYFKNLFTKPLKEKNANEIILEVSNLAICTDIIMSFYGIPIDPIKFCDYRYALGYVKCCDYWLVPHHNILTDDLKVPEEDFDLLLQVAELMNYSDLTLKIISKNIPSEYDLSGIPNELKIRMIGLNKINYIASGSYDKTIKIWDLESGALIKTLNGHTSWVYSIEYIPGKNQIASGSHDGSIKIWDLDSGTVIKTLSGYTDWVYSVCYIPEKNQIVSGSNGRTIKIWNLESGKEFNGFQPGLERSPAGKDKVQPGWETSGFLTGAIIKTLTEHTSWVFSVCYIPGKNQIASGKDKVQPRWESDRLLTGSHDNTIKIWDLESGALINILIGHANWVRCVCYIPEKNQIASGSSDMTIRIWNLDSGKESERLIGHTGSVTCVCYIPGKNQIASGSWDKTIKIWDLDTGTVVKTLTGHTDSVYSVCYIPEKNQIVSGGGETIKIWNLDSGKDIVSTDTEVKTLHGHTDAVNSLCHIQIESDIAKRLKKLI